MTAADPVLVEIVAGTLAAIEKEVETSIGRTSRSPMIRDAHDFRAGIHDRQLRKLTGRSYSALVHPVVRDHPIDTMRPVSSNSGRKAAGATSPWVGCCHRSNASTPRSSPVSRSTCG